MIAFFRPAPYSHLPFFKRWLALPAYHLLLWACFCVLLAHVLYIPVWLFALGVLTLIMQKPSIKNRWAVVGKIKVYRLIQLVMFVLGVVGLIATFGVQMSADIAISFLVLCFVGKLWELNDRRDGYVALNLALFVVAAAFLWSQTLFMGLFAFGCLLIVLFGLIALSDDGNDTGVGRLKAWLSVGLPAIPLLVVLFLFFPRISPLWVMPMVKNKATTGISDTMSPGDFTQLSQSTELAFRAFFHGQKPAQPERYWRAMVLDSFDGVTWRQGRIRREFWGSSEALPNWAQSLSGNGVGEYDVMLAATQQPFLFVLDFSRPLPKRGVFMDSDFVVRYANPVAQDLRYQAQYLPNALLNNPLSERDIAYYTAIPSGNNQTRQLAQQLANQANGDVNQLVNLFYEFITGNEFYYTLNPEAIAGERIDGFLFNTRQGFCEHYASSFVFFMRAAGVPARVVTGYQGGEDYRDGAGLEVRQMDAHAWAEIWTAQGWQRVDPTAFVAPERIRDGMASFVNERQEMFGEGVAGLLGYQQFALLQKFRHLSDEMGYYWQRSVVGYDDETQKSTLKDRFGIQNIATQMMVLGSSFVIILVLIVFVIWYRRRKVWHALDKPVYLLSKRLGGQNKAWVKQPTESYFGYLQRMGLAQSAALYRQYRFGAPVGDESINDKRHVQYFVKTLKDESAHK